MSSPTRTLHRALTLSESAAAVASAIAPFFSAESTRSVSQICRYFAFMLVQAQTRTLGVLESRNSSELPNAFARARSLFMAASARYKRRDLHRRVRYDCSAGRELFSLSRSLGGFSRETDNTGSRLLARMSLDIS